MRKFKYLLFLSIFFLTPTVFADDFNVTSTITAPTCSGSNCSGGHYTSLEIYNTGSQNVYTTNTRYNGQISSIRFNVPIPSNWPDGDFFSTGDLTYTLTLNMATNDWRNYFARPFISNSSSGSNWATSNVVFVNKQKIYFNFKIPNGVSTDFLYVYLQSTNPSSTAFTGVSNWNLSNIVLTANFPTSSGGGSSGGGSTGATNQDIINNQNNNTNSIINNQNDNTNNIIDNANQNTQDIIDNQKELLGSDCKNLINLPDLSLNKDNNRTYSYYLPATLPSGTYTLSYKYSSTGSPSTYAQILLNSSTKLDLTLTSSGKNTFTINSDFNRFYILISSDSPSGSTVNLSNLMLVSGSSSVPYCKYGSTVSKLDETTNAISDVNDSINNSNVDNDTGTGFFDNFTSQDFGLSQIVTIPLNTIQSLTSKSCVPLQVPIPFTNSNINLPCMTEIYETKLPTIYNLWKIVSFGIIAYLIAIDIFHMVKGFKDPESDKVEVLDL